MAKPYKIPDFRKLYPEASEEVIAVLRMTERKMQYQEYDLKTERTVIDQKTQTVRIIPSREDSYERLLEQEVQFEGENQTEESVIRNMLHIAKLNGRLCGAKRPHSVSEQPNFYQSLQSNPYNDSSHPSGGE